jgi:hypothetical protein
VLSVHPERRSGWVDEAAFSLAAAVSYSVYGTPLGTAKANVYEIFRSIPPREDTVNRIPIQQVIARTAAGDLPAADLLKTSTDGVGAGYPIFASLAMQLFGPYISSLIYSFLLLVGISTLVFFYRYRDDRLFMVPLLFLALTLMLLSPLTSDQAAMDWCPIAGGMRYFGVAGVLPALYIIFEVADVHEQHCLARAASSYIYLRASRAQ